MNTEERKYLLNVLKKSEEKLLTTIEELSEAQFMQKKSAEHWSFANVIEHIILVDQSVLHGIKAKAQDPPETIPETFPKEKLLKVTTNRTTKVKAPPFGMPKDAFDNKEEAIEEFKKHRTGIEYFVENTDFPLKRIAFQHFIFGLINGEGWIAFMAGHCNRHILQMEEMKAALV